MNIDAIPILNTTPTQAVLPSGTLLVWVTGAGVAVARASRSGAVA